MLFSNRCTAKWFFFSFFSLIDYCKILSIVPWVIQLYSYTGLIAYLFSVLYIVMCVWNFSGDSDGKESACNMGDPCLPLGWRNPPEKGMATHSCWLPGNFPCPENSEQRSLVGYSPWSCKELAWLSSSDTHPPHTQCVYFNLKFLICLSPIRESSFCIFLFSVYF